MRDRWEEFEALGEAEIRRKLGAGSYDKGAQQSAREWLAHKATERAAALAAREDASKQEEIAIAREAASAARDSADAARDAAREAKEANRIAKQANTIAKIAALIAIASALVTPFLK
jgi:hypothetical protein